MNSPHALPEASFLQLLWLASPALPVGGFAYSEGLEAWVSSADQVSEATAAAWLVDQLHLSLARGDLAVLSKAIPAWRDGDITRLAELNAWVLQTRESSELRMQTEQMGRSLLEWLRNHDSATPEQLDICAKLPPSYPLAFALAAACTEASVNNVLLAFAFGWAENMTQAAIKAVPLGQSAGQRILARLTSDIPTAVAHAMRLRDSERQAFSPMLAILSAQHETQYSRLFRS